MNVGKKLKQAREELGISQRELAAKSNIPQQNISKYELGSMTPHLSTLKKLADSLDKPIAYFLSEDDSD